MLHVWLHLDLLVRCLEKVNNIILNDVLMVMYPMVQSVKYHQQNKSKYNGPIATTFPDMVLHGILQICLLLDSWGLGKYDI